MHYRKHFTILFFFFVICGFLLYLVYSEVKKELVENLNKEQMVHARQAGRKMDSFFLNYQNLLTYIAGMEEVKSLNEEGKRYVSNFYFSHSNEIKAVTIVDSLGVISFTVPFSDNTIGRNISSQSHVKELLKTHKPVLSNVFRTVQGYNSIAYYMPVFKGTKFAGGIAILIPFDDLTKSSIEEIKLLKNRFAWIINQSGTILYNSLSETPGRHPLNINKEYPEMSGHIKEALAGKVGSFEYQSDLKKKFSSDTEWYAVYYPLQFNGNTWTIIVSTPKEEILGTMRGFLIKCAFIFLFISVGGVIYLFYVSKARAILKEEASRKESEKALISSEKKFRTLVEVSPDGIILTDLKWEIITCNKKFINIAGFTHESDVIGLSILDFIPAEEKGHARQDFESTLLNETIYNCEYGFIRGDGELFPAEISMSIIFDKEQKPTGFTAIVRDISERKAAEKELIEAKERAERSDKLKTEFLAQMSHEIRSPINSILSFSGLLKDELQDVVSEDLQISFTAMENSGQRIIRTIDLILNMSELQTGVYEASYRDIFIIEEILEKLYVEFRHMAQNKNLELMLTNKTGLKDLRLHADEYTIGQIFNNLINNAIKYTNHGSVEILLSVKMNKFIVEIIDTGIGISKEYLPNLFSPFSQEEQGYTRKFEGNGLGLALVRNYCRLNNLEIEVESEKGKGSVFRVVFPEIQ